MAAETNDACVSSSGMPSIEILPTAAGEGIGRDLVHFAEDKWTAGATPVTRLTEMVWGDRVGRVRDPLGNIWWIQERLEEPDADEVARRLADPRFTEGMQYVQSTLATGLDAF